MPIDEYLSRLDATLPVLFARMAHHTRSTKLGPAAIMVLRKIRHGGACTVSELADWLGVTSATITGITNKLADQGFIVRNRAANDRRVVRIDVTDAGLSALAEIERIRKQRVSRVLSNLSIEDLEKLTEIVDKLLDSIRAESGGLKQV